jgi:hypothetical protein
MPLLNFAHNCSIHPLYFAYQGGKVNLEAAARSVLKDWNIGKIPFYTLPPVQVTEPAGETEYSLLSALLDFWSRIILFVYLFYLEQDVLIFDLFSFAVEQAAIVSGWTKEFDIASLLQAESKDLNHLNANRSAAAYVQMVRGAFFFSFFFFSFFSSSPQICASINASCEFSVNFCLHFFHDCRSLAPPVMST